MRFDPWRSTRMIVSTILITIFAFPQSLMAQTHVVSQADIHKELVNVTRTRKENLEKAKRLFSLGVARNSEGSARIETARVNAAVSRLSDAELAQLASRADKLQGDFAAGRLSDRDLLMILLGVAGLILIIVAVR